MPVEIVQGTLADAQTADGRRDIRKGFGETEEDDLLYALGWPHMVWLVPGDAKALDDPDKFFRTNLFEVGPRPVGAVPRMLRAIHALRHQDDRARAIQDPSPIRDDERDRLFDHVLPEQFGMVCSFLLEALFSSRVVCDGLIERLEWLPVEHWMNGPFECFGGGCLRALYFMMLRCDASHAEHSRERLEAVYTKVTAESKSPGDDPYTGRALKALDLVLHGRSGVERSGFFYSGLVTNDLVFANDDRTFVRERALDFISTMKARDGSYVDARLAFLGGDPVIEAIATNVKEIHSEHRDALAVGLSRCRHPRVRDVMTGLASKTAKRWLKAHA